MEPIRVLLVDDHQVVRAGLRLLLGTLSEIAIVAEAADGPTALRALAEHDIQVVLLDLNLPGIKGLELVERLRRDWPAVRVVILSVQAEQEVIVQALRAGAAGYLLKDAGSDELCRAIRQAAAGETYLAANLSQHVVRYLHRTDQRTSTLDQLTPRQREVLEQIAQGATTKEIARHLHISVKTVETHRMQLMERLGIHDIAGLTRFAIRMGVVKPD